MANKAMKKLIAWVTVFLMVFNLCPFSAFAESGTESGEVVNMGIKTLSPEDQEKLRNSQKTWTVTFYDRDAEVYSTIQVTKGEAIGDQLPAAIYREDYLAGWAIGEKVPNGQGYTTVVTGQRIDGTYVPEGDISVVPDYDYVTYTFIFYQEDQATVAAVRTVTVETRYCLNDIPEVPAKAGSTGKWVYSNGDFTNSVCAALEADGSGRLAVWPVYEQNVFTAAFMVDGETYQTDTYYIGDALRLPEEPVLAGRNFTGWVSGETAYHGGEPVTSDLTLTAAFNDRFAVSFVIPRNGGTENEVYSRYFRSAGEAIGALPESPFEAGSIFEKWVIQGTDTEVTADTAVNSNMTVAAAFRPVTVYNLTAEYYYLNDSGREVVFNTDLLQMNPDGLPYTITAPATIRTDPAQIAGGPVFYPETPVITVQESDFTGYEATVRFRYVAFTAEYDFVYLVRDLAGNGYTEIDREHSYGVLNSYVTPTVKTYEHYSLERAEGADITRASGQELRVYYVRKNNRLSYETNGGSYVGGGTYPYGSTQALSATVPSKTGYTFAGWYLDEALTRKAGSSVTLDGDTTVYAAWKGDQVNYTIVYMIEKYNDTGTASSYVYGNSKTASASVGTTVSAGSAPNMTGDNASYREKDTERNKTSSVEIAADGSSVLYVYYKLSSYTLTFNRNHSSRHNEAIVMPDGSTTTDTYSITVKLGQDISTLWPSGKCTTSKCSFRGWQKNGSGTRYITKQLIMNAELMPTSGKVLTWYANWGSATERSVNYYLENADDNNYTRSAAYSQTYYSDSGSLNPKEILGYVFDHRNDSGNTFNFYYKRLTYTIDHYCGDTKLDSISNIKFDAHINKAPYKWTPTAASCGVDSDYTFAGWYSNSSLTTEYNFSTMPASNLVLYAKWTAPSYTVTFADGDNTGTVYGTRTVEKYKKVNAPETSPAKAGYSFEGWYAAADGNDLFDWNTQIMGNTTVYARWFRKMLTYTVHYVDEDGKPLNNDKIVSNPNHAVGQTVEEKALAIAGYRPVTSTERLTLSDVDAKNEITFVYLHKADTTSYTVRYLLDPSEFSGNIPVADEKTVDNVPGDTASVIELAEGINYTALYAAHPELNGIEFYPDEVEKTLVLTADAEQSVLTFVYSSYKQADVIVHFTDMDGNSIAGDDVRKLKVGSTFTLERVPIEGWDLNKAAEGTDYSGTAAGSEYKITESIAANGLEFTLFYQKKATVTVISARKQYDGEALTLPGSLNDQVAAEGLLDGDSLASVDYSYTDADAEGGEGRLNAGTATVKPTGAGISGIHGDNPDYYTFCFISGTLEVTRINVTIRIEPDRWTGNTYDGTVRKTGFTNPSKGIADYVLISHGGYAEKYLNDIWAAVAGKAVYDPSAAGLQYIGIAEADADDYTYFENALTLADLPQDPNYSVSLYIRPGRLQILPKAVTISTGSGSKYYDGTPLTNAEATIEGLVAGETYALAATGTITEAGSVENTYTMTWAAEGNGYTAKAGNYTVTENLGTLTVTAFEGEVTLIAPSASKVYDGAALVCDGTGEQKVTATGLPEGFTVIATASGSQTDAGSSENVVNDGYIIRNAAGEDRTASFTNVKKAAGTLTVEPKAVTISTGSGSKYYDGTPLTNAEAAIEGLVAGETYALTATGTITEAGSVENTYTMTWAAEGNGYTAKAGNYTVTENLGNLAITANEAEVILTAPSANKIYDGIALTCDGTGEQKVTATGLPEGFTVEATANGSQTDAGSSENVVNDGYIIRNAAGEDKTASFTNVKKAAGTLTVEPKTVTISTGSGSKAYDGTPLTNAEATIEGLVAGETYALAATGTITETGSVENTYTMTWAAEGNGYSAKAENYTVTENLGTLAINANEAEVILTAPSASKVYDGIALVCDGTGEQKVTATGLPEGFIVIATASGSQTDAGSSENVVNDGYIIKNAAGEDRTSSFTNVKKAAGTLTVEPKAVTISTGSGNKAYDGTPLTNAEATIEGLVAGETYALAATGTITEVGNASNTYEMTWAAEGNGYTAKAGNYTVTENLGTLAITENEAEVVLTAPSASKVYDGIELVCDGTGEQKVTATGLPEGFTVIATASSSQTDAGRSENVVNDGYIICNAAGEDRTASFTNVKKAAGTLTVEPKAVTISTGSGSKAYDGTPLTNAEATIEGLVAGETYALAATGTITEAGSVENTYTMTWAAEGNNYTAKARNYTVTENLGTLAITANEAEVILTAPSASKIYDGIALTCDGTGEQKVTATGLPEGFTVIATASGSQTDAGSSENVVNDGYIIRNAAGEDKTASFTNVKKAAGTLTVEPKAVTITTGGGSKEYDGTPLTNDEAIIEGLVAGETYALAATGTITEVGDVNNTYSITWATEGNGYTAKAGNYTVTENLGTLAIIANEAEVILTAPSESKTYDGIVLTCDGTGDQKVTATGLPDGFTVEATASGSQTDAGSSENVVNNGYIIRNAAGEDKTASFTNVKKVAGTLTVEPKAVTISTGSGSKAYDGMPLTNAEVSIEGLVAGETYALAATGTITEVGSTDNTYTMTWAAEGNGYTAKAGNYTVTENLGILAITANEAEVILTAPSDSKTYDGAALTCDGTGEQKITATGLPEGFTVIATASGSRLDAGSSENVVNDGYIIRNTAGEDKTVSFTNVKKATGTLTVEPKAVTISTGSGSKVYDGKPLTNAEATVEGLVAGETYALAATGTITEVGSADNTYTMTWAAEGNGYTAKAGNYTVTENLGILTIAANEAEVTLTAPSDSKVYDGTALTCDGTGEQKVAATGLPEGFTVIATASGSQTDAGSSENVVNDGYVIRNAAGEDKTASFTNVKKTAGTLTVEPKPVTISTGSGSKAYDGIPLTNAEVTIEGLVVGETYALAATGTITEVGSTDNTYTMTWAAEENGYSAKAGNYTVTENLGILTITENDVEITLTAPVASKTYDGVALTCDGTGEQKVTATGLPEGFTVIATASGSQTDAGSSENVVNDGYIIRNAAGEDKTASFTNAKKVPGTLTVEPKAVTISTGSGSKAYDGMPLTNAEASIEGLVAGEKYVLAAIGTITEVGSTDNTYTMTWAAEGNEYTAKAGNYTITENLGTLTVTANEAEVILTAPSASKVYDGTALTCDGTGDQKVTANGLPEGFTVEATASGSRLDAGNSENVVNDGYIIRNAAGEDRTASFTNVKKAAGTLTVEPKTVTISTGSGSKAYDGTPLTNTEVGIDGLVAGETYALAATGTITEVGSTDNTYTMTWAAEGNGYTAKAGNYTVTENLGILAITANEAEVILTAPSDSKTYDGAALTCDGTGEQKVTATGLPEGLTVIATASGSQTDAGSSENVVNDGYIIRNAAGEDRTASFTNVKKAAGTLTVEPKAVTISTGSGSKAFDGTPLTNAEATIEGLVAGETYALAATGTITETGSVDNTYTMTWAAEGNGYTAKAGNYTVTENLGTLTITENEAEITLTAPSASKVYDGVALTCDGTGEQKVTAVGLPEGFTVEATASGSQTDAGSSENVVNDGYVIRNAAGEDRTASFTNVKKAAGTLTVEPKAVTITTGSGGKAYDGTPLTNAEVTVEGLVAGETYALAATGTITEVGNASNTYEMTWAAEGNGYTAKAGNYTVTETLGTLTITENEAEVVLTAPSASKVYDGATLVCDGTGEQKVTATGLPEGFTVEATASGSRLDAGSSENVVNDGYIIRNTAGEDRTASFTNVKKAAGTLTVEPKAVTISTGSGSKAYDGTPLTNAEVGIEGLVGGETYKLEANGTITEVGNASNTYEMTWAVEGNGYTAKAGNYTVTENLGTLNITANEAEVILIAPSASKIYDGIALTCDGTGELKVTATGLPEGFMVEATASGSRLDAGSSENVVNDGYIIRNAVGEDKMASFTNVKKAAGTLTVEPKAVTISTGNGSKVYDGKPLTNAEATVEGLVAGETYALAATGTITEVGNASNTYTMTWAAEGNGYTAKAGNYIVTENLGTLAITANEAEVILTAPSASKVYDGTALTCDGTGEQKVTATGLPEGFTVEATASGSQTDAGSSENVVNNGYIIRNAAGEDKTASFTNVKKAAGTLTVEPKAVTISTGSGSKAYDGTPLMNAEAAIEGLVAGETYALAATGTITEVGDEINTYSITWATEGMTRAAEGNGYTAKAGNYTVTENLGTLAITANEGEVILTAPSASKVYDGTALVSDGTGEQKVTATGLPEGFTVEATASGSQTDAGSSENVVNDGYIIRNAAGEDKTASFTNVKKAAGTLTVEPKAVTISTGSGSKAYDGTPLTNAEATIEGLVTGETYALAATGTITEVGNASNTYTMTWAAEGNGYTAKAGNYIVTENLGTLAITANEAEITLTAPSASKTYDGAALTCDGTGEQKITATGLPEGFTVIATASGSRLDAGSSENVVNDGYIIRNTAGEDRTASFTNVKKAAGTLTVEPRTVILTSASENKAYDGTGMTWNEPSVTVSGDGFANGEGAVYEMTGNQNLVGESLNTFTYTLNEGTKAENYTIITVFGTLTVTGDKIIPVKETPEAADNYRLGDRIPFTITVFNAWQETAANVEVADENAVIMAGAGYTVNNEHNATIAMIGPDMAVTVNAYHIVTEEDILAGTVGNTATVTYDGVSIQVSASTDAIEKPDTTLAVNKRVSNAPADGKAFKQGETIEFAITVKNEGNTAYTNVAVTDESTGFSTTIEVLAIGEEQTFTTSHIVDEADVLVGNYTNTATAKADPIPDPSNPGSMKTPEGVDSVITGDENDPDGPVPPIEGLNTTLTVNKAVSNTPANGEAFVRGETIEYTITVKNEGNVAYTNVVVTDESTGFSTSIEKLAIGEEQTFMTSHIVDEADVLVGNYTNTATAKADPIPDPSNPGNPKTPEGEDSVTTGDENDPDGPVPPIEGLNTTLTVNKAVSNTPANGEAYVLGETIEFTITVKNEGNTAYTNVIVTDESTGFSTTIEVLAVGEEKTFTTSHIVDEADVLAGSYTNTATVKADPIPDPSNPGNPKTPEGEDTVTTGDEGEPDGPVPPIEGLNTTLTVNKKVSNTPANGEAYVVGETIEFTITVKNDGNTTYTNVAVTDESTGFSTTIEKLAIGEEQTFTTSHTVNEADVLAGSYTNTVTAKGDPIPDPKDPEDLKTPEGEDSVTTGDENDPDGPVPPIEVYVRLTVNYRYDTDNVPAAESFTNVYRYGTEYAVTSPVILGYTADQERATGILTEDTVLDVTYTINSYTLTVNSVFLNGAEAAPAYTETLAFGAEYSIVTPGIAGFYANQAVITGTMPARDVVITIIYTALPVAVGITEYNTPLGFGTGNMSTGEMYE